MLMLVHVHAQNLLIVYKRSVRRSSFNIIRLHYLPRPSFLGLHNLFSFLASQPDQEAQ